MPDNDTTKQWAVVVGNYKANPKVYTKRDGLKKAQLETAALDRYNPDDADSSLEMVHFNSFYPLLYCGIAEAEGFTLPLSEETFWDLPEQFVFDLSEAIKEVNPQYSIPFWALQKSMWENFRKNDSPSPDLTATPGESDKTSS